MSDKITWTLVPLQPTPEMLRQAYKETGIARVELADTYRALLNAAPGPTLQEVQGLTVEQQLAYHEAQDGLLTQAQEEAPRLREQLAEVQRPLDAQMARLNQRVADLNAENDRLRAEAEHLRAWRAKVIRAAEQAHGPEAIRFKLSLRQNGTATNVFPEWLDQRWVSFVFAEDDAHIGYIAKALEAAERAA